MFMHILNWNVQDNVHREIDGDGFSVFWTCSYYHICNSTYAMHKCTLLPYSKSYQNQRERERKNKKNGKIRAPVHYILCTCAPNVGNMVPMRRFHSFTVHTLNNSIYHLRIYGLKLVLYSIYIRNPYLISLFVCYLCKSLL